MKNIKFGKILLSFFMLLCFVLVMPRVEADYEDIIIKTPSTPTAEGGGRNYIGMIADHTIVFSKGVTYPYDRINYPVMTYKEAHYTAPLLCATGLDVEAPLSYEVCSVKKDWFKTEESYGVAYIIWKLANESGKYSCSSDKFVCGVPDNTNMLTNTEADYYYWMEILTLGYLGDLQNKNLLTFEGKNYDTFRTSFISSTEKNICLNGSKECYKWSDIIKEAKNYAANTKPTVTLSSDELVFTKNGDIYESNWITLDGFFEGFTVAVSDSSIASESITFETTNNQFKVKVSNVQDSVDNITVMVTVSKSSYYATKYDCGSEYQEVIPAKIYLDTAKVSVPISGAIVDEEKNVKVTIKKVDKNEKLISDSKTKLKLVEVDGNIVDESSSRVLTGGSNKTYLEKGKTYRLTETISPTGYEKLESYITITVSEDGKVSSSACYEDCKDNVLHVVNNKIEVLSLYVKKTDGDGNLLNDVKMSFFEEGKENAIYSWITASGKNPYNIPLQKNKTYILKEISAPKGYATVKDTKVVVDNDGNISIDYQGDEKNAPVVCETTSCSTILVKNIGEIKVPNTAASRSALLIISGILLSVLGVFLGVNAVRKNKEV